MSFAIVPDAGLPETSFKRLFSLLLLFLKKFEQKIFRHRVSCVFCVSRSRPPPSCLFGIALDTPTSGWRWAQLSQKKSSDAPQCSPFTQATHSVHRFSAAHRKSRHERPQRRCMGVLRRHGATTRQTSTCRPSPPLTTT